ncbi:hypothetical protein AB1286_01855 [Trinickia sp. NRRL B-1857]|uniref:hypothetical protein n=1 Tax=Trinickia sp. NRRL B-1857 TaxID=3162879 RepID=UPI003D29DFEF
MANKQAPNQSETSTGQPGSEQDETGGTFKTDVSETDDEGTTVRKAEVHEDDLTEVDRSKEQGHS